MEKGLLKDGLKDGEWQYFVNGKLYKKTKY